MQLSRTEFERRYAENRLRIAFIGMSNIGKSYTSSRLSQAFNFELIQIDKLIWESLGQSNMADFAVWQGQPYSEGYAEREAKSIALESDATAIALAMPIKNAILDTTGSVIYTSKEVQKELTANWYMVHISASEDDIEKLKAYYFKHPKPLIWNGHYKRNAEQTENEAILTSYPTLLASRALAYADLADVTISSDVILNPENTVEQIFGALKPSL